MTSNARSRTRLESTLSIVLLAVLLLIAAAVLVKQACFDMARFGLDAAGTLYPGDGQGSWPQVPRLAELAPDGYAPFSRQQRYEPSNLYEKIDGKAPFYIEAGLQELLTQRFVSRADDKLWMELYLFDMADVKNAFSVYSSQRRAGVEDLAGIRFAYKTSNGLYFVHGRYYVELLGSAESLELLGAMTEVAEALVRTIRPGQVSDIPELALFPSDGVVPGSFKLVLKDAFGFDGLTEVFLCRYEADGGRVTAFISRCADAAAARKTAKSYLDFLVDNGATPKSATNGTLLASGAKILDFYGTTEIVFTAGAFLGGIHEAEDRQRAERLAAKMIEKLTKLAGPNQ